MPRPGDARSAALVLIAAMLIDTAMYAAWLYALAH